MKRIYETCPVCRGKGIVTITDWSQPVLSSGKRPSWKQACGNCKGTGKVATRYWLDREEA